MTATIPGQTTPQTVGQLTIANFVNDAGLLALGGNLFQQTAASGQPNVGVPGDTAFGVIQQGYLEASNVDPVSEITNLISAQRAYEMNSKVIQAADQMAGTISNMRCLRTSCAHRLSSPACAIRARLSASALGAPAGARGRRWRPRRRPIIYPGDIISEDMLTDAPLAAPAYGGPLALAAERHRRQGRARARCCPANRSRCARVDPPRVVRAGAAVKMIYVDGGLTITAIGAALQDGAVGRWSRCATTTAA